MWYAHTTAVARKVSEDAGIERKPSDANARPTRSMLYFLTFSVIGACPELDSG